MLKDALFGGVNAAVLTAMHADLSVDLDRMAAHSRWLLANGCNGLGILGTTGEANSLGISERIAVMEGIVARGIPASVLLPGTGTTAITDTVLLTRRAEELGCRGALLLPPFFYKNPSEDGLFAYFSEVIQRVGGDIRLYLYHFPAQSAVPFTVPFIARLLAAYPGKVKGIKDSSGDFANTRAYAEHFAKDGFEVYCGDDGALHDLLHAGGAGCITAAANVGSAISAQVYANWDQRAGADAQVTLAAIRRAVTSAALIPGLKALVARHTGDDAWNAMRPPHMRLDAAAASKLFASFDACGLQLARGGLTAGLCRLAAALALAAPAAAWAAAQPHGFLTVALAPDGAHVAALESDTPAGGGDALRSLVLHDVSSGAAVTVALPCGRAPDCAPGAPAWSPDGRQIAFALRSPGSHARTVYTVAADGTHLVKRAAFDGTVVTLRYSRDGRLAALAVADADKEVGASEAGAASGGAVHEQRIAVVGDGALAWASPADLNVYEYDWLPDGSGFVGTAAAGDGDAHWWRAKLYAFAHGAGRVIYAPEDRQMQIAQPRVSPDGSHVAFVGGLMSDFDNTGGDAFLMRLDGHGSPANLTAGQAVTVTSVAWHCGGSALLAGLDTGGETGLADIPVDGGPMRRLWTGAAVLNASDGAVSLACRDGTTAAVRESFTEAPEIAVGPIGAWRAMTTANAGVRAPVHVQTITWSEGGVDAQGWLLLPAAARGGARMPMIVVPHGGPAWAYVPSFFGPSLLRGLSDAGYALFLPNPRGSYGRGEAFVRADTRDFGGGDFRDIMAGVDAAIRAAPIDPDRLGITGVSYGGFMTMWAVSHTTRFKAAVARAGISDWVSYYGQNGIGDWLVPYFGASLYDDPQVYARASPILAALAVRTPTLMLVGERDIECPPAQTQEFAHALTELSIPNAMIVYPGEGHAIRDAGHAADAQSRAVAWFGRWLH